MPKTKNPETRYFKTDIVSIPIDKIYKKSDAYRGATKDGWGIVYTTNESNELICDEDCSAILINQYGEQCFILPYEDLNPKAWFNQAECHAIITSNDGGFTFWEKENGIIKIYVTYDKSGFIDTYRLAKWTESPYDGETEIKFEDLPLEE